MSIETIYIQITTVTPKQHKTSANIWYFISTKDSGCLECMSMGIMHVRKKMGGENKKIKQTNTS